MISAAQQNVAALPQTSTPVQRGILRRKCDCGQHTIAGGECNTCKNKTSGALQRSAINHVPANDVPSVVHDVLNSPGQPLDTVTRAFMEPRFGHDFSRVRVHTDSRAAQSAQEVNALAYTVGNQLVFAPRQYEPNSQRGKKILAHELMHVVQQGAGVSGVQSKLSIGEAGDASEHQADRVADAVVAGESVSSISPISPGSVIQRVEGPCEDVETPHRLLIRGSVHPAVREAQRKLNLFHSQQVAAGNAGVADAPLVEDCIFGQHTFNAVYSFQQQVFPDDPREHDGKIGDNTWAELDKVTASPAPAPAPPAPAPTPPAPAPPAPRPPEFVCGPDVTDQIKTAVAHTKTMFAGWSETERTDQCHALTSLLTGAIAWDIIQLHQNAWILTYRPACATAGANPRCGSSVKVGPDCHYAGSSNYVIFGVMCKLCNTHFTSLKSTDADDYTEAAALELVNKYKGTGFTGLDTPSANFKPSQDWTSSGFRGWPGASQPAGDRSNCDPTCPTAYTGVPFEVNWLPKGLI
jgi:hypothetical protein